VSAALLAVSYTENVHPASEALSLLRPLLALGCGLAFATKLPLLFRGLLILFACGALTHTYSSLPAERSGGDIRLYSKNVRYDNTMIKPIVDDIIAANVELVMLQEISEVNRAILQSLRGTFPFQHICKTASRSDVALLSKHAFIEAPQCTEQRALLIAKLEINGKPTTVMSAHIPWPWPANNSVAEQEAWKQLEATTGLVVMAGDFNSFAWSQRMARIQSLTGTFPAGPLVMTLDHAKLPIPMPLDYAFAPEGGTVETRPLFGSDHLGIVA